MSEAGKCAQEAADPGVRSAYQMRVPIAAEPKGLWGARDSRFGCGLVAGLIVTATLNPWDRALFLCVVRNRPFFSWENWQSPYRGLAQTLAQRSVSSGLYFPLEDIFTNVLGSHFLGGQTAGVVLGVVMNPLAYVKYRTWGDQKSRNFMSTAKMVYRDAGPTVFYRGVVSTIFRDAIFGGCFALRRVWVAEPGSDLERTHNFAVAAGFAAIGTTLSSPFNYVRNMSYAESTKVGLESLQSKREFWRLHLGGLLAEVRKRGRASGLLFLQQRMQLGWGTLRVAVGMATTDQIYRMLCSAISVAA